MKLARPERNIRTHPELASGKMIKDLGSFIFVLDSKFKQMKKLSHIDKTGKANMVDVSSKPDQKRTAIAEGFISLAPETIALIQENSIKKGDVLTVAEIAGIQAAKQTANIIPLCHPLQLSKVGVKTEVLKKGVKVTAKAVCTGKTGVEMEALHAVSASLLTIYDMCKAVDKNMEISGITLLTKKKEN